MYRPFYSDDEPSSAASYPSQAPGTKPLVAPAEPTPTRVADDETWWQQGEATAVSASGAASAEEGLQASVELGVQPVPEEAITMPLPDIVAPENLPPAPAQLEAIAPSPRGLAFAALRDIGRLRSVNQDSVFGMLATVPRAAGDVPLGLFVVADGMGGHEGGDVASRMAISAVARVILADLLVPALDESLTESLQELMIAAVQEANRVIWNEAQAMGSDMGTTCTAVVLLGHTVYTGHVGDSRAYVVTPGGLRPLTSDHSAVGRLIELGQIDAEEAREHPPRSHLYRTVGQMPEIEVDYDYYQLGEATHLFVCSDGLWSMIDEADMLAAIHSSPWPQDACRELIARANAAGGEDNISAVVVSLP